MAKTRCLVGNSSSGIREGAFIGTPAVNVGTRQTNRQRGRNIVDSSYDRKSILRAIEDRLSLSGQIESEPIYGDGKAGPRIADILSRVEISLDKRIAY